MARFVIDASALLACLTAEKGGETLAESLHEALLGAVNLAETISVLMRRGASLTQAREILGLTGVTIVSFDRSLAEDAGALTAATRKQGLSLGDRACLALAKSRGLPVFTADRAWEGLDIGVDIRLIR